MCQGILCLCGCRGVEHLALVCHEACDFNLDRAVIMLV